MGIFSSLFGGSNSPEKETEKKFDILKYDGIRAMRIGKLTYAIKCFEEATTLREDLETMTYQANAYARLDRMDDARNILERAAQLEPRQATTYLSLANLCYITEDYVAMNKACQEALTLDANLASAHFLSAKASLALGNGIQAIASLTRAIVLDETYVEAYQLRAEVLWQMRQVKDASEDINRLLEMNPEDENALLLKAELVAAEGRGEEALNILDEVLALNPFCEKAYLLKGNYFFAIKELDRSIAVYDEAIEINPNFASAYHERGRVKLAKGDKQGSMEDMKRAIELAPEQSTAISGEYHNYEQERNIPF